MNKRNEESFCDWYKEDLIKKLQYLKGEIDQDPRRKRKRNLKIPMFKMFEIASKISKASLQALEIQNPKLSNAIEGDSGVYFM